mgnify:FL=1
MHKFLYLLFITLLTSCTSISNEEIRVEEYGEEYAVMDCFWPQREGPNTVLFWCDNDLETTLISGFVSLAIERGPEEDEFFSICGRDIILNSGYDLHDTLIASLTNNSYNCYNHYENKLGNEFDSLWDPEINVLQIIWRPPDDDHQVLTLYIPPPKGEFGRVSGTIYHKIGIFN